MTAAAETLVVVDPLQGRWTAELDGDFIVFLIGATVYDPAVAAEASGLLMTMTEMLDELEADPSKGLLGYTRHGEAGSGVIVQAIYQNMPAMGLQRAGRPLTVSEATDSARARITN